MTILKTTPKKTVNSLAAGLVPGVKKHFPNGSQKLTFGGGRVNVTVDEALANMQSIVDTRAAVVAAGLALRVAVAAENGKMPALLAFLRAFEAFIRLNFEADDVALADFGLAPPRARTPLTAEQKAVAAAKAKATRVARGIGSKKALKAIKGNVTAAVVVTPIEPAAPHAVTPAGPAPAVKT